MSNNSFNEMQEKVDNDLWSSVNAKIDIIFTLTNHNTLDKIGNSIHEGFLTYNKAYNKVRSNSIFLPRRDVFEQKLLEKVSSIGELFLLKDENVSNDQLHDWFVDSIYGAQDEQGLPEDFLMASVAERIYRKKLESVGFLRVLE